jgi:multidrug efflux pump subunit AcrA (membrane-fusion protein)
MRPSLTGVCLLAFGGLCLLVAVAETDRVSTAPGRIRPAGDAVPVQAQRDGLITGWTVGAHTGVESGQPLGRIDTREDDARLAALGRALERTRADIARLAALLEHFEGTACVPASPGLPCATVVAALPDAQQLREQRLEEAERGRAAAHARALDAERHTLAERRAAAGEQLRWQQPECAAHRALAHRREAAEAAGRAREAAHRFARLHVAATLLGRGMERFRQDNQAPLLREASAIFARLTGGRYPRLEARDGEDGKTAFVALARDGSSCPVPALSEGARDQLFLALRLAAVEQRGAALPFVADDLLASFDDARAVLALRLLAARGGQTILLTHHRHLLDLADGIAGVSRHDLSEALGAAA